MKLFSGIALVPHSPGISSAHNMHGSGRSKVRTEDQRCRIGVALYELGACFDSHFPVPTGTRGPVRLGDLCWMVYHVAGDNGLNALRAEVHTTMARRMPRRRFEPYTIVDDVVSPDHHRQSCLHNRRDAIVHHRGLILVFGVLPELPLLVMEQVPGVWKCRHPPAVFQTGIPAHMVDMHVGAEHIVHLVQG